MIRRGGTFWLTRVVRLAFVMFQGGFHLTLRTYSFGKKTQNTLHIHSNSTGNWNRRLTFEHSFFIFFFVHLSFSRCYISRVELISQNHRKLCHFTLDFSSFKSGTFLWISSILPNPVCIRCLQLLFTQTVSCSYFQFVAVINDLKLAPDNNRIVSTRH